MSFRQAAEVLLQDHARDHAFGSITEWTSSIAQRPHSRQGPRELFPVERTLSRRPDMTRKSEARLKRGYREMPKRDNIAAVILDRASETILFTTNDMLVNQLQRDGPRVARSFDRLANDHITACSGVFGRVCGMLLNQLQLPPDNSFKATTARLLSNACNSYVASIEVARHGFPRQYGAIARMVIETVATVIVIAVKQGALEQFHAGKLESQQMRRLGKECAADAWAALGFAQHRFRSYR